MSARPARRDPGTRRRPEGFGARPRAERLLSASGRRRPRRPRPLPLRPCGPGFTRSRQGRHVLEGQWGAAWWVQHTVEKGAGPSPAGPGSGGPRTAPRRRLGPARSRLRPRGPQRVGRTAEAARPGPAAHPPPGSVATVFWKARWGVDRTRQSSPVFSLTPATSEGGLTSRPQAAVPTQSPDTGCPEVGPAPAPPHAVAASAGLTGQAPEGSRASGGLAGQWMG